MSHIERRDNGQAQVTSRITATFNFSRSPGHQVDGDDDHGHRGMLDFQSLTVNIRQATEVFILKSAHIDTALKWRISPPYLGSTRPCSCTSNHVKSDSLSIAEAALIQDLSSSFDRSASGNDMVLSWGFLVPP